MASVSWTTESSTGRSVAVISLDKFDASAWQVVNNATGVYSAEGGSPLRVTFTYNEMRDQGLRDVIDRLGRQGFIMGTFYDSVTGVQWP